MNWELKVAAMKVSESGLVWKLRLSNTGSVFSYDGRNKIFQFIEQFQNYYILIDLI